MCSLDANDNLTTDLGIDPDHLDRLRAEGSAETPSEKAVTPDGQPYLWDLNHDVVRRAELLGLQPEDTWSDLGHFSGLEGSSLRSLVDEGFASPDDAQNDAPETRYMLEFLEAHPAARGHGYAVPLRRPDYRVSIEGLAMKRDDLPAGGDWEAEVKAFRELCRRADEYEEEPESLYAWWD